jgi:thiol-disulfide isomerase/thioredoxin
MPARRRNNFVFFCVDMLHFLAQFFTMKLQHLSALFLCLFYALFAQAQGYTLIEGSIKIPDGKEVNVTIVTDALTNERTIISTPLDEQGNFKLAFRISNAAIVRFEHGFENMLIYVTPNQRTKVTFEADSMWKTIQWSGDGANNNNYMVAYHNQFDGKEVDQTYIDLKTDGMSTDAFALYANNLKDRKMRFLNDYILKHPFTDHFEDYARGDVLYNWGYDLLRFAASVDWLVPHSYYNFLTQIPLQNNLLVDSRPYNDFLQTYLTYQYQLDKQNLGNQSAMLAKYNIAQNLLTDEKIRYFTLAKLILNGSATVATEGIADLETMYTHFEQTNPYLAYAKVVGEVFANAKKFAPGSFAPDFSLQDLQGNTVFLSDFRGKVVYLDFWASWCHACLQQTPYIKELKQQLNDQDVVFLYVSVDKNDEAWRNMVAKKALPGVHLRIPDGIDSEIAKQYNIGGVPLYFMIDQEGKFASKPPLPSAKQAFIEQVSHLVNKHKTRN